MPASGADFVPPGPFPAIAGMAAFRNLILLLRFVGLWPGPAATVVVGSTGSNERLRSQR